MSAADAREADTIDLINAGQAAFEAGRLRADCPHGRGTAAGQHWQSGYDLAALLAGRQIRASSALLDQRAAIISALEQSALALRQFDGKKMTPREVRLVESARDAIETAAGLFEPAGGGEIYIARPATRRR